MLVYIGSDHRGFSLKEFLKSYLKEAGYSVVDVGNSILDQGDDYPDYAKLVAERISVDFDRSRGIVICGSGAGVIVTANKYPNVRSAVALTPDQAYDMRNDDDINVLGIGANYVNNDQAKKIVTAWLQTPFAGHQRFRRRIEKISQIEMKINKPRYGGTSDEYNSDN